MTDPFKNKVDDLKKVLHKKREQEKAQEETLETPLTELGHLEEKLKAAEEEAKQTQDKLLRVIAEFDNYKKRVARDHDDRVKYNLESVLKELLPVMDDFDRLMDHLPTSDAPEIKGLTEGVNLLHRHFMTAMKKFHLEVVETEGKKFDPHFHEALGQVESDDHETGDIVTCHRKGYRLHDRLLRPALVTIAKEKENHEKH